MHESASNNQPKPKIMRRSEHSAFDFQQHCAFGGEKCIMKPDPHHPGHWRTAKLCRTADLGKGTSFKDAILNVCHQRKDAWAKEVEHRVLGAISNLHAADAHYHNDCRCKFMSPQSVQIAAAKIYLKTPMLETKHLMQYWRI